MSFLNIHPMVRIRPLAVIVVMLSTLCAGQESGHAASIRGTVRDSQGKEVNGATVHLFPAGETAQSRESLSRETVLRETKTGPDGSYVFESLSPGSYRLRAEAAAAVGAIPAVFVRAGETKTVDLTLSPNESKSTPQFYDSPSFTVSGVTDTTSLGGHGSDTVVRTRETLAKDTVSLGKTDDPTATSADTVKALQKEIARDPENAAQHHRLAGIQERLGDALDAAREYQRAAELDPSEPNLYDWGSELLLHHAPEPAQEVFSRGNRLFPRSVRMLLGWGAALFAQGSSERAAEKACLASDLKPDDPGPYLFLGRMLSADSAPSTAVTERLRQFALREPQNAQANYYAALALRKAQRSGDSALAEALLKRAIGADAEFAEAHLQLGIVYADRRDFASALAEYKQAAASDPHLPEPHFRMAQVLRQTGHSAEAKREVQIYDRLTRESEQAIERERHEVRQFVYALRDPAK